MGKPLLSIIVPTHKRARLLRRALSSILMQWVSFDFEIIVVSDCVDAGTSAVCDELLRAGDIYIRRNGVCGPSQSRNLALRHANGSIILFLDDDDAFHPGAFEQFANSPSLTKGSPIYFNCSLVKERRLPNELEFLGETTLDLCDVLTDQIYVKNRIPNSCLAFPAHCIAGIFFDEYLRAYEDWEFVLAVLDRTQIIHEPILGVKIYQVDDDTTDRRGSSEAATDYNAVLDYIHIYRRHPAPNAAIKAARADLLTLVGIPLPAELF